MIVLLAAAVVMLCLLAGSLIFVASLLVPPLRVRALSIALWFAACGPCLLLFASAFLLLMLIGGTRLGRTLHLLDHIEAMGWVVGATGLVCTLFIATAVSWIHQRFLSLVAPRFFCVYAGLVCAGMGGVLALWTGFLLQAKFTPHTFLLSVLTITVLTGSFGYMGTRFAEALRPS